METTLQKYVLSYLSFVFVRDIVQRIIKCFEHVNEDIDIFDEVNDTAVQ